MFSMDNKESPLHNNIIVVIFAIVDTKESDLQNNNGREIMLSLKFNILSVVATINYSNASSC